MENMAFERVDLEKAGGEIVELKGIEIECVDVEPLDLQNIDINELEREETDKVKSLEEFFLLEGKDESCHEIANLRFSAYQLLHKDHGEILCEFVSIAYELNLKLKVMYMDADSLR